MSRTVASLVCFSAFVVACGGSGNQSPAPAPGTGYRMTTPDLMLNAGDEKYLCYTVTLQEMWHRLSSL